MTTSAKDDKSIDNVMHLSLKRSITHRLPWLIVGLGGGLVASSIVSGFEDTLRENLILAAFIPLIVYMSDAVGTQMEAFAIRDFALHQRLKFGKYFVRHFLVTTLIALILSLLLFFASKLFYDGTDLSIVLSLSLFFSIISSVITGLILPRFFRSLKLDPANASGPVATIIQDILSVIIYFTIASALL